MKQHQTLKTMELNQLPENTTPKPFTRRMFRISKCWKQVRNGTHPNDLKGVNDSIAMRYHRILRTIKQYYLPPGTLYFERDYKDDNNEPFALHRFVCEHFSFYLECDLLCIMQIHYDFHNFNYEDEVLNLLALTINSGKCFHRPKQPNLPVFFKSVVDFQDPVFIHLL